MKTTTKTTAGIKVKANVKAGGFKPNHIRSGLKVSAGIKAGGRLRSNHALRLLVAA